MKGFTVVENEVTRLKVAGCFFAVVDGNSVDEM